MEASHKVVYYIPLFKQCLCGACFEPIYEDHLDYSWEGEEDGYEYCGIAYDEVDEHCHVCVQSAED